MTASGTWPKVALALLAAAGCVTSTGEPDASPGTTGTAGSSGSTGGSSGSGGGASTTGTTSGGRVHNPPSPFVDGGYVFCTLPKAADGGPNGDGGPASWMCTPGTYVCDLGGDIGNCFQCQSDADCANQGLPTYDPRRPHCDLASGQLGHQGLCQECVDDSDCAGNPAGPHCDINPLYPLGALEPPIDTTGFETCGAAVTDCRLDGGPFCLGNDERCDRDNGQCVRPLFGCATDQDCQGTFNPAQPYLPTPFCSGGYCELCAGGNCPYVCASSADCGDFWPICEALDAGYFDDQGQPSGFCGCDQNAQCGDGGLVCLPAVSASEFGVCGPPCTWPSVPPCSSFGSAAICDSTTGLCVSCASDEQCQAARGTPGFVCRTDLGGICLCSSQADCPFGETCETDLGNGVCTVALAQCARSSCPDETFCNWDSGACDPSRQCLVDSDCSFGTPFCDPDAGACSECRDSADCLHLGAAATGRSMCSSGYCYDSCASDQDCAGNGFGPACLQRPTPFGGTFCGCGSDADCAGNPAGPRCDLDPTDVFFGSCVCASDGDCGANQWCDDQVCNPHCVNDDECSPNYFCDSTDTCRSRCDDGDTCQGAQQLCDVQDIAGKNGELSNSTLSGVIWCYQCLSGSDCAGNDGCVNQSCGQCTQTADCAPGLVCTGAGCQPRCDAGGCPNGEACDALDVAGYGAEVCLPCVTAADCPDGLGCSRDTHLCGSCVGPTSYAQLGFYDCPPDAVCSNYWGGASGACLLSCDRQPCPASRPLCRVIPSLTTQHEYCVGCLADSDCADAGPGAWCDVSVNLTFACQAAR